MKKKTKRILIIIPLLLILGFFMLIQVVRMTMGQDAINVGKGIIKQALGFEVNLDVELDESVSKTFDGEVIIDESIEAFKNIGYTLGELGLNDNVITLKSLVTFDANGDGLQDIYIPHSGRPTARPHDENGVLNMEARMAPKPSTLFLNQGNDENGDPIFISIQELLKKKENQKNLTAELIIENKYVPRTSLEDDSKSPGRNSQGAIAGDFNGDGRIDLFILNSHWGAPFAIPGLGLRIYPGANHLGRVDKDELDYIEATLPPFLHADIKDGSKLDYQGEGEGLNTLFINLGDSDKDGIPEWKNATESAGINTNFTSTGGSIFDIDRDGDLDLFVTNFIDPDFWGFGIPRFPGNPNTLWINQMSESGELRFIESATQFGVSGSCDAGIIDCSIPLPEGGTLKDPNKLMFKGVQQGFNATHSWAALSPDINEDGYPDLIVANDVPNKLEVYINEEGKSFRYLNQFDDPEFIGCWMGLAYVDLDQDGEEEFMATNCGSATYSVRNTTLFVSNPKELGTASLCQLNGIEKKATISHLMLDLNNGEQIARNLTPEVQVNFNPFTAPDVSIKNNVHPMAQNLYEKDNYANGLAGLEFSWNPSFFDIENDGDLDLYLVGALNRGNDNFIGDWSGGVGRMLINNSTKDNLTFDDKTYEYRLFDIDNIDYSNDPPRKASPGTGWHKEDYVYFTDLDSYSGQGFDVSSNSVIKDILRMHESACGNIATDLNNDGNVDIIVPHSGGYASLSTEARNLKVDVMGKALAIPPPNKIVKALTTYEPGKTFVYINQVNNENNWVKITLDNSDSFNKFGVGAKLIINDKIERNIYLGGKNLGMNHENTHVGLGTEDIKSIKVIWPDGDMETQEFEIDPTFTNTTITLKRAGTQIASR